MLSQECNGPGEPRVYLHDASADRAEYVRTLLLANSPPVEVCTPNGGEIPAGSLALTAVDGSHPEAADLELIHRLQQAGTVVLAYCAGAGFTQRCRVLLAGARDLLDSSDPDFPARVRTFVLSVWKQLREQSSHRSTVHSLMRLVGAVGQSAALLEVMSSALRISQFSDLPVLVTGETGTGKELVAAAIHACDPRRRNAPFIPVNCGGLDADLAGSELFGHRKGAYTGAAQDRPGLFRAADGGVLFLDEIGELPLPVQARLLRVVQTRRVLALGDDRETPVDVRIVAATNRDLSSMIGAGTFREDLYYRLNVTAIHIPPLRERRDDIGPLVEHFLFKHTGGANGGAAKAAPEFLHALASSELAGNARQVENLVCHALVRREGNEAVGLRELPRELLHEVAAAAPPRRGPASSAVRVNLDLGDCLERNGWNLQRSLSHVEDLIIRSALAESSGNQAEAARRLGITPRSIYNKLHRSAS